MRYRRKNSSLYRGSRKLKRELLILAIVPALLGMLYACDVSDFGDMNTNPTEVSEIEPRLQLPTVQLLTSGRRFEIWRANLIYGASIAQHFSHPWWAGEFYQHNTEWVTAFWSDSYTAGKVRDLEDLLHTLQNMQEEGEEVDNKLALTRILRVYIYHQITDLYGDTPYSEAGQGFLEQEFTPAYDSQEFIYNDMLNELEEAVQQFDPQQPDFGNADLLHGGDIEKWQKFGNSLRLRLALRLTEVDPSTAQEHAVGAINAPGGVKSSNEDITYMEHETGPSTGPAGFNTNANSEVYIADPDIFLSQTMVDWMQERDDPRVGVYGALINDDEVITDPAQQRGRPNGYTATEIEDHPSWTGDVTDYSRLHPRFMELDQPMMFQTYAEVEFMKAEVAARGWQGSVNDAAQFYNDGVRAAMTYLTLYGSDAEITNAQVDDYLDANPFNTAGSLDEQLEQIHEQYWAAVFLNGIEAWSNFRRTGYPDLEPSPVDLDTPHPSTDTGGEFIRRLEFPESEQILNSANYEEAVDRMGADDLLTPVWWDTN